MSALLSILLATTVLTPGQGPGHDKGVPPGLAKKGGLPPGQAKKGSLPPGLAKRYGRIPERPYMAVDPRYQDRAYFLIDGRWELHKGLTVAAQGELRDVLRMPMSPPPVPLPRVGVDLHVVLFN